MALGLAAAASDCSGGVREIVRDGVYGVLFPAGNVEAMAAVMAQLMGNPQECSRLGNAARAITERFSAEKVIGMWESMLQELVKKPS